MSFNRVMASYSDRWIDCDDSAIVVRAYYFPWCGTKRIPYDSIRSGVIVPMSPGFGRMRLWGTANPSLWASLDPQRPSKDEALILDLGGRVKPFLTPDDIDAVALIVHQQTGLRILRENDPQAI